jgi:hypothetical protein
VAKVNEVLTSVRFVIPVAQRAPQRDKKK